MKSSLFRRALFAALLLASTLASADNDRSFLLARDAFRAGDWTRLERAASTLDEKYPLMPYVDYFRLRMQIEQLDPAAIDAFTSRHRGTYISEKMLGDWLRLLAKKERWPEFFSAYTALLQPEHEVACLSLRGRLRQASDTAARDEALALWQNLPQLPDTCLPVMQQLVNEDRLRDDDVWRRIRQLFELNRRSDAQQAFSFLPHRQSPEARQIDLVTSKPAVWLKKLSAHWAENRLLRELTLLALQRLAGSDPAGAADELQNLQARLPADDRRWIWSQIALQGARQHLPQALGWYAHAGSPLSDEAAQWKVRAALRALDWGTVRTTIEAMPPLLASRPEWLYWLGRAYKAGGRLTDAQTLFARISGQASFYGNLADEELGKHLLPPPQAAPLTAEEKARAAANPALQRALALFRLDLRTEAVREWNWGLRGMSDRELLAAADLAHRAQIFDRAINTADKTRHEHDYQLRYLAPFSDQIRPAAQARALDDAWVYGLMRQESRFILGARSTVGAAGLMQLMPATARWVAKKIGLNDFHPQRVHDPEINITLGTSYMQMVLASLGNHPLLASAAYNAGPSRARRWQDAKPLEGAIYAETIPFTETRDYVKKVMSNAVYYTALFTGQPDSLKARLGTVAARSQPPGGAELP